MVIERLAVESVCVFSHSFASESGPVIAMLQSFVPDDDRPAFEEWNKAMRTLIRRLSKVPNYVRRFGLWSGLRLLFQIERTLPSKSESVRTYRVPGYPDPVYLRESISDHAAFWQCLVLNQYEFRRFPQSKQLMECYQTAMAKGVHPLIIDCGGNIGLATIWFAAAFPQAKIFVIEPEKGNLEILRRNTRHFGERVTVLEGGIWNESGRLHIVNPDSGAMAFRVTAASSTQLDSMRAYTVDEVCALAKSEAPFIVKLDIEGAQRNLFLSNTDWVGRTDLITLELDDWLLPWQGTSRTFFSCISKFPYDYLLNVESIFCFRDRGPPTNPN